MPKRTILRFAVPARSESAGEAAERPGFEAARGGVVGDLQERVDLGGRELKYLFCQRLARDRGRARFRPRTPTSSGHEAEDRGTNKIFTDRTQISFMFYINPHSDG
jgi:hypothetical protein